MTSIQDKISNLGPEQRKIFNKELIGICEWQDLCRLYGAKDSINLPEEDILTITQNLYLENFEEKKVFTPFYEGKI